MTAPSSRVEMSARRTILTRMYRVDGRASTAHPATAAARARVLLAGTLATVLGAASCASFPRFGPLRESESGLPGGASEERAFFGFWTRRTWPDGSVETILRPFAASVRTPDDATRTAVVPPFVTRTVTPDRRQFTAWPLVFDTTVGTPAEQAARESDDDTLLAPFLAFGHEPGQKDYFALFPLFGTLRQKLLADRITFAAFPVWAETRSEGWESTHVLWPLIAWGDGTNADGPRTHRRFLPFWSQSDSANRSRRTAAWPLVHWGTETAAAGTPAERTTDGWFVFPLGGRRESRDGSFAETSVLWPLFEWSDDARNGDSYRAVLWPFHRTFERPGVSSSEWWWPVHGSFRSADEESDFWAWPIGWTGTRREAGREFRRRFVVPIWMERSSGPVGSAPDHEETRAWPFFSSETAPGGLRTVRFPEIVPFFGWRSGESTYADLAALVRWSDDRDGRAALDLPLSIVRWRRDAAGASKLTLLWFLTVPTGGGE